MAEFNKNFVEFFKENVVFCVCFKCNCYLFVICLSLMFSFFLKWLLNMWKANYGVLISNLCFYFLHPIIYII